MFGPVLTPKRTPFFAAVRKEACACVLALWHTRAAAVQLCFVCAALNVQAACVMCAETQGLQLAQVLWPVVYMF
jgi:hypothetical protein